MNKSLIFIFAWLLCVFVFARLYNKALKTGDIGNLLGLEFTFYDSCSIHIIPSISYLKSIPLRKDGKYYNSDKKVLNFIAFHVGKYAIYVKKSAQLKNKYK